LYVDPATQRLRHDARAAALIQQAGGPAPPSAAAAQPGRFTTDLYQPDAATSMGALLRATAQVWPVEAPAPQGLAPGTVLRPYQRQSLAFMLDLENAPDSDERLARSPRWNPQGVGAVLRTLRGGWLCDEVGMGKTLSVISLILARPRTNPTDAQWKALQRRHPYADKVAGPEKTLRKYFYKGKEVEFGTYYKMLRSDKKEESSKAEKRDVPNPERKGFVAAPKLLGGARQLVLKATVISCPVTLIGQWQDEIRRWAPELRILVNHGSSKDRNNLNRGKLDASLREYDVIIVSPNTRLGGDSLLTHRELRYHRLIVDEAHATRGATERFLAEYAVTEHDSGWRRRTFTPRFDSVWLVTGTPFTNGLGQMKSGAAALGC
jgi:SNF2 family DNA or RNA helicase